MRAGSIAFYNKNGSAIKAGLAFAFLATLLMVVITSDFMQDGPVKQFTATLAWIAGKIIGLWDDGVTVSGTVVSSPRFSFRIVNGCNGVEVTALLTAAMLASPGALKKRIAGVAIGSVIIYALNLFRTVVLFEIGSRYSKGAFDFFHVYVFQTVVVLIPVAFFLGWIGSFSAEER